MIEAGEALTALLLPAEMAAASDGHHAYNALLALLCFALLIRTIVQSHPPHGIAKVAACCNTHKAEGGMLLIHSHRTAGSYMVTVLWKVDPSFPK